MFKFNKSSKKDKGLLLLVLTLLLNIIPVNTFASSKVGTEENPVINSFYLGSNSATERVVLNRSTMKMTLTDVQTSRPPNVYLNMALVDENWNTKISNKYFTESAPINLNLDFKIGDYLRIYGADFGNIRIDGGNGDSIDSRWDNKVEFIGVFKGIIVQIQEKGLAVVQGNDTGAPVLNVPEKIEVYEKGDVEKDILNKSTANMRNINLHSNISVNKDDLAMITGDGTYNIRVSVELPWDKSKKITQTVKVKVGTEENPVINSFYLGSNPSTQRVVLNRSTMKMTLTDVQTGRPPNVYLDMALVDENWNTKISNKYFTESAPINLNLDFKIGDYLRIYGSDFGNIRIDGGNGDSIDSRWDNKVEFIGVFTGIIVQIQEKGLAVVQGNDTGAPVLNVPEKIEVYEKGDVEKDILNKSTANMRNINLHSNISVNKDDLAMITGDGTYDVRVSVALPWNNSIIETKTVKVNYTSSWVAVIPSKIEMKDKSFDFEVGINPTNGITITNDVNVKVGVSSKNAYKLKDGLNEISYELKHDGVLINGLENEIFEVGILSKGKNKFLGNIKLIGITNKLGQYNDTLTYSFEELLTK